MFMAFWAICCGVDGCWTGVWTWPTCGMGKPCCGAWFCAGAIEASAALRNWAESSCSRVWPLCKDRWGSTALEASGGDMLPFGWA